MIPQSSQIGKNQFSFSWEPEEATLYCAKITNSTSVQ